MTFDISDQNHVISRKIVRNRGSASHLKGTRNTLSILFSLSDLLADICLTRSWWVPALQNLISYALLALERNSCVSIGKHFPYCFRIVYIARFNSLGKSPTQEKAALTIRKRIDFPEEVKERDLQVPPRLPDLCVLVGREGSTRWQCVAVKVVRASVFSRTQQRMNEGFYRSFVTCMIRFMSMLTTKWHDLWPLWTFPGSDCSFCYTTQDQPDLKSRTERFPSGGVIL